MEGQTVSTIAAITDAVKTGLASVQTEAVTMIGSVLPYAIAVMGGIIVVSIGLKVFKKVTGR